MIKHCFVMTSAVNSKFGVYSPAARLQQTLTTITSIKSYIPDAKIIVMECTGTPLTDSQSDLLEERSDLLIDYSEDAEVQAIYNSTDNWDIVKNSTEILCFGKTLRLCLEDGDFDGCDRIHKMSGRYVLNSQFAPTIPLYEQHADRIIIGEKYKSQFPPGVTGIDLQYMARLWSWPADITERIIKVYEDSLYYLADRVKQGGYADIEHVLYKFLPADLVTEIPVLGVEGSIAPNGQPIQN
jgi:hypothetical protein